MQSGYGVASSGAEGEPELVAVKANVWGAALGRPQQELAAFAAGLGQGCGETSAWAWKRQPIADQLTQIVAICVDCNVLRAMLIV